MKASDRGRNVKSKELFGCFGEIFISKIQIGFAFLVLADLGSPRKRAVKRVCVCVVVRIATCYTEFVVCYDCLSANCK